jgi:predicted GNAT family acetyltransferase
MAPRYEIIEDYALTIDGVLNFGTLFDNKIVSVAKVNADAEMLDTETITSIGVGTHTDYRRKGYAAANAVALSEYLLDIGKAVEWSAGSHNEPSQKSAMSVGFVEFARSSYLRYKKKEEQ